MNKIFLRFVAFLFYTVALILFTGAIIFFANIFISFKDKNLAMTATNFFASSGAALYSIFFLLLGFFMMNK